MRNATEVYKGDVLYLSYTEYLDEIICMAECFLYKRLVSIFGDKDPYATVCKLRLARNGWEGDISYEDALMQVKLRIELMNELGGMDYLERLVAHFEDKDNMRLLLVFSWLVEEDDWYRSVIAHILGKKDVLCYFNVRDYTKLLFVMSGLSDVEAFYRMFQEIGNLAIIYGVNSESSQLFDMDIKCDKRLISFIMGKEGYLPACVQYYDGSREPDEICFRDNELKKIRLSDTIKEHPIRLLYGSKGEGKKTQILVHAKEIEREAVVLSFSEMIGDLQNTVDIATREAWMRNCIVVFADIEVLEEQERKEFARECNEVLHTTVPDIYLTWNTDGEEPVKFPFFKIRYEDFDAGKRHEIWKKFAGKSIRKDILNDVANTFYMSPGQIKNALGSFKLEKESNKYLSEKEILYRCCYAQFDSSLSDKSFMMKTQFTLEDLKLEEVHKETIVDICNCIRYRNIVMNEWGFKDKVPYGAGITVLFAGPPGTGKTMAAQVISNELNMELYKIDLSQVVDKYVGETEKNIREIFTRARKRNSILFFDEADSIFNKRMEVTGSNERFANMQSSLLLQYIEEYDGIVLLATNNVSGIDPAFIRRVKYYIPFRRPDEQTRFEIWKSVFPKNAPVCVDEDDFKQLAESFDFTGAVIKNVAMSAAFLAASHGGKITPLDILKGIKREMDKDNQTIIRKNLGSLGYLYDDVFNCSNN